MIVRAPLWSVAATALLALATCRISPVAAAGPREREHELEQLSPAEIARRAAEIPDRAPLGPVSARRLASPTGVTWSPLGPAPIAGEYWSGSAPGSGRVNSIAVHPKNGAVAYIAAAGGGVWRTADGGATWAPMTDGLSSLASGSVALDLAAPDTVYYGTGEQNGSADSYYGDGLFRSYDAGVTWSKIAAKTSVGSYISRVAVDSLNPSIIVVGSDIGVVRSADHGATWATVLGGANCTDLAIDQTAGTVMFAAMKGLGVYKSTDSGATWTKLAGGLPTTGFARINMGLARSNGQALYVSFVASNGSLLGMYRTTNGGTSFTKLTATPNYMGTQGWYDNAVVVDPTNPAVVWAMGMFPFSPGSDHGVILTLNGGASWADKNFGVDGSQPHPDQHHGAYGPDGAFWIATDGGVWKTLDRGQHWTNCNTNLSVTQFYSVAASPSDPNFICGGTQDQGAVAYGGTATWSQLEAGDGGPTAIEWLRPSFAYTTYVYLTYMERFNNGVFEDDITGPWGGDRASWCSGPLVADPNVGQTLYAGTYRVWKTSNAGVSWSAISGDLTNGFGYLRAIAVAGGLPSTIYTGSSDGRVNFTSDGVTWTLRNNGLPALAITDLVLDPGDWQTVYASFDSPSTARVYVTHDAGLSWTPITGDLPATLHGLSLAGDFRVSPARLYLGTDYGVYVSRDLGAHWVKADGLPSVAVFDMQLDLGTGTLVAATHGRGMWRGALDVSGPTVAVTAPNGGESYLAGSAQTVTWSASDPAGVDSVSVLLSTDGGATYATTLAHGLANSGSLAWTAPATPFSTCRIEVIAYDGLGNARSDASDADFAVVAPQPVHDLGVIALVAPLDGALVAAGTPFTPRVSFVNAGDAAETAVTVRYQVRDPLGALVADDAQTIAAITPSETLVVVFSDVTLVGAPADVYAVTARAELAGDASAANDSLAGTLVIETPAAIGDGIAHLAAPTRLSLPLTGPQPFRDRVDVVVGTPRAGSLAVEVFDVRGHVVAQLPSRRVGAGYTTLVWNGRDARGHDAPGGVYFVTARLGGATATARIVKTR